MTATAAWPPTSICARVAMAIVASVRDDDYLARWGGDEFCALAVECREADARALRARVHSELTFACVSA
jgi:GGDEF domain-containing protein